MAERWRRFEDQLALVWALGCVSQNAVIGHRELSILDACVLEDPIFYFTNAACRQRKYMPYDRPFCASY
jgi:hypothetical protein